MLIKPMCEGCIVREQYIELLLQNMRYFDDLLQTAEIEAGSKYGDDIHQPLGNHTWWRSRHETLIDVRELFNTVMGVYAVG